MYNQGQPSSGTQPSQPASQGAQGQAQTAPSKPATQQYKPVRAPMPKPGFISLIITVIVILVVIGVIYTILKGSIFAPSTTTSITTTIASKLSVMPINGCTSIKDPGSYYLAYSLKTSISNGTCINVNASNVNIVCNSNKLSGSGPFGSIPPYTYGIKVNAQKNVSISGCTISNFSFALYSQSSSMLNVSNNNFSINYMSDLYLNNTRNSTVVNNYLSKASSIFGALYLTNGTSNVSVYNNTIRYNQFYGISVNSTKNIFDNNHINGTQFSFYCAVPDSFVSTTYASSNLCFNNSGCGFLQCRGINIPANISKITLAGRVASCGTIRVPGTYIVISNINMRNFVNVSNPLSYSNPCINIASSNVKINCNGLSITNSTTAIIAQGVNNVTISNCRIRNSKLAGIVLYNSSLFHINNVNLVNDSNYGVSLVNSTINTLSNVTVSDNYYGISLSGSYSNSFDNVNSSYNTYGFYLDNFSLSSSFLNSLVQNNTKVDIYATLDSANTSSGTIMQSTTCGTTDAAWANCKRFISVLLSYTPIKSCMNINTPGNYLLTTSILNSFAKCIQVTSSNVNLNCNNKTIYTSIGYVGGAGLLINRTNNVTVDNCDFQGFNQSVNVTKSSNVRLNNIKTIAGSQMGIVFNRDTYSGLYNSSINGTKNVSLMLSNTSYSSFLNNSFSYGLGRDVALMVNSSSNNKMINNTLTQQYIGFYLNGRSVNNTIQNNTVQQSTYEDFICTGGNSGLQYENGGINYATKKLNCHWLAAITKISPYPGCAIASQPGLFLLSQDAIYPTGATCFSAFNVTTVNCAGHTVIATDNGTFASFLNSPNSNIENCFLKGFSNPIRAVNSTISVFNNSIMDSNSNGTAISVGDSRFGANVKLNNVTNSYKGILVYNVTTGSILNNIVSNSTNAYYFYNASSITVKNNTAQSDIYNGMTLSKSSEFNNFQNNNFMGSNIGLQCLYNSQGVLNNTDAGGNSCSLSTNCFWIKSSSSRCQ